MPHHRLLPVSNSPELYFSVQQWLLISRSSVNAGEPLVLASGQELPRTRHTTVLVTARDHSNLPTTPTVLFVTHPSPAPLLVHGLEGTRTTEPTWFAVPQQLRRTMCSIPVHRGTDIKGYKRCQNQADSKRVDGWRVGREMNL